MDWLTLLGLAVALLVPIGIVAIGGPLVARRANAALVRRTYADTYDPRTRVQWVEVGTRITPLDLGPDPLMWPSASGRVTPYVEKLAWPSASWDDDAFGNHEASEAAEAARRRTEADRHAAIEARRRAVERPARPAPTPAAAPPPAPRVVLKARPAPETPPERPASAADLDPDQILRRLQTHGLARTVADLADATDGDPAEILHRILDLKNR